MFYRISVSLFLLNLIFATSSTFSADNWCIKDPLNPPCDGAPGRCTLNSDGSQGGFVAHSASVSSNINLKTSKSVNIPWVGKFAQVCDTATVRDNAFIGDFAKISGNARVYGNASVFGNAKVNQNAQVYEDARVYDNATVFGNAVIYGTANIYGDARVYDDAKVYGVAKVHGAEEVNGKVEIYLKPEEYGDTASDDEDKIDEDYARKRILIVDPTSDWNGAFKEENTYYQKLLQLLKEAPYRIKKMKATSVDQVLKHIERYTDSTRPKLRHVMLRGHGHSTGLNFAESRNGKIRIGLNPETEQAERFFETLGVAIKVNSHTSPTVLLDSCSTGVKNDKGECLGDFASAMMPGVKVYAPNRSISQSDIQVDTATPEELEYNQRSLNVFYRPFKITASNLHRNPGNPKNIGPILYGKDLDQALHNTLNQLENVLRNATAIKDAFGARAPGNDEKNCDHDYKILPNEIRNFITSIKNDNTKEKIKQKIVPLLNHYQQKSDVKALCQNLIQDCNLEGCEGGSLIKLENSLNQIFNFDSLEDQLIHTQEEFKDYVISNLTLTKNLIQALCKNAIIDYIDRLNQESVRCVR